MTRSTNCGHFGFNRRKHLLVLLHAGTFSKACTCCCNLAAARMVLAGLGLQARSVSTSW